MKFLQLLQEASTLNVTDLKKAMLKDKHAALIFKKDLTIDDIEDKEAFLATLKYFLLNNEHVRAFVASRHNVKDVNKHEFDKFRKIRSADLKDTDITYLQAIVTSLFKEHASVERATLSGPLNKELKEWINSSGRYYDLPQWAKIELMSVPGIRPTKRTLLYRGVLFSEESLNSRTKYDGTIEEGSGLKFLKTIRAGGKEVDLTWDRTSSWTTSKEVATRFAKYGPANSQFGAMMQFFDRSMQKKAIDGALGYVIAAFVEPKDILIDVSKLKVQVIHGDEAEMIVMPGKYLAKVVRKFTVEGETDPAVEDADKHEDVIAALTKMKEFVDSFKLPEILADVRELENGPFLYDASNTLRIPSIFKKLILNSATTEAIHSYDKIAEFFNANIKDLKAEDLRADKFATNPELGLEVKFINALSKMMNEKTEHSKFKTDKNPKASGPRHMLSGEEFRNSIKCSDLTGLERDLVAGTKITKDGEDAINNLARHLNVALPKSTRFSMFGAAKQAPIIDEILKKFFDLIGLNPPDERVEQVKMATNLMRKAFRNYRLLLLVERLKNTMEKKE